MDDNEADVRIKLWHEFLRKYSLDIIYSKNMSRLYTDFGISREMLIPCFGNLTQAMEEKPSSFFENLANVLKFL
jgi:hypothetical protein